MSTKKKHVRSIIIFCHILSLCWHISVLTGVCVCVFEGFQVLPVQMPQNFKEAKPKKDQMDQSVQEVCGQRADGGEKHERTLVSHHTHTLHTLIQLFIHQNKYCCVCQDNSLEFEKRRNIPLNTTESSGARPVSTHTHTSHTHAHTYTHSHTQTHHTHNTLSHTSTLTPTHTHTLSHTSTLTHTHPHAHSTHPTRSLTHTHPHAHSLKPPHTLTPSHTPPLTITPHTPPLTHSPPPLPHSPH